MPIYYSEIKQGRKSVFKKTITNSDGEIVSERKVTFPMYNTEKEGYSYIVLYDDDMNVIRSFYRFINIRMKASPINSRSKSAHALRLLYCFLELSGYKIGEIGEIELNELITFLRGLSNNPEKYSMQTVRSADTINGYLSVYRTYFAENRIRCKPLFLTRGVTLKDSYDGRTVRRQKYARNLLTPAHQDEEVPKYIYPDAFKDLYTLAYKNNDRESMLIMHLMYGYGLRLGEVLGLTIEDIVEIRRNKNVVPALLIRNRLSDKDFQFAKNRPHVITKREYTITSYRRATQTVVITYDIFDELYTFIEETHQTAMEKYPDNYAAGTADIVSVKNAPDSNHYVFLNRYGRILSDQTFNNQLKKYFNEAGIPLDYGVREDNLAHRFRHGYAMFHAHFSKKPVGLEELKIMMRHADVRSTMKYYNPTFEDQLEIKTEFQKELYDMVPELKENIYGKDNSDI